MRTQDLLFDFRFLSEVFLFLHFTTAAWSSSLDSGANSAVVDCMWNTVEVRVRVGVGVRVRVRGSVIKLISIIGFRKRQRLT